MWVSVVCAYCPTLSALRDTQFPHYVLRAAGNLPPAISERDLEVCALSFAAAWVRQVMGLKRWL